MPKESPLRKLSHIPRPRMRSSSCDARSQLKPPGKPGERNSSMSPSRRSNKRSTIGQSKSTAPKMSLGKTPQKQGRPSTFTPGKSRQNISVAQNNPKDARALQDKSYQAEMVNVIEEFFNRTNQAQVLNNTGNLKPISLKSFVDATKTLLQVLGIPEPLTVNNYVEFLPIIAKKLRYPAIMNKSWLKTANAMHSLPSVLGWLSWLTILADAKLMATERFQLENLPFEGDDPEDHEKYRRKLITMISSYNAWNNEEKDTEAKLISEYYKNEESALGATDEKLEAITKKLEEMRNELDKRNESLRVVDEEEEKLKNLLQSVQSSEAEEDAFSESVYKQIEDMSSRNVQICEETKEVKKQTKYGEEEMEQIESIISKQTMTVEERDLQLKAIADTNDYIVQLDKMLEELKKMDYTLDMKLMKLNKDLTDNVNNYRSLLYAMGEKDSVSNSLEIPVMARSDFVNLRNIIQEKCKSLKQMRTIYHADLKELLDKEDSSLKTSEGIKSKLSRLSTERKDFIKLQKTIKDRADIVKQHFTEQKMLLERETEELIRFKNELVMKKPDLTALKNKLKEIREKIDALNKRKTFVEERAKLIFTKVAEINNKHVEEMNKMFQKFK